jgi:NAD+ kinase
VARKIGLVVKSDAQAEKKADELQDWLAGLGASVVRKESPPPVPRVPCKTGVEEAPGDLSFIFVLGGDGTFLSAVRWAGARPIPILGVKFGEVGFLAETVEENLFTAVKQVLSGDFEIQSRMRLSVEVLRDGEKRAGETVLNDLVINKGALARLSDIKTFINDNYLTTYRADGLIIATPTGSTAYSLAAGGPVIHPGVPGILMTPICPFTLTNRPLIVPDAASIRIELPRGATDLLLTFDGQAGLEIDERDVILVEKGAHPIHLITFPGENYFDVLKAKLRWSGGRA